MRFKKRALGDSSYLPWLNGLCNRLDGIPRLGERLSLRVGLDNCPLRATQAEVVLTTQLQPTPGAVSKTVLF